MTAIAYRDGVMAADANVYNGQGNLVGKLRKITKVNGALVATSGAAACQNALVRWVRAGCTGSPDFGATKAEDIQAIVVLPSGAVLRWSEDVDAIEGIIAPFFAIGCGASIMIGAMAQGATAAVAVRIACDYDAYCGGEIQVECL